MVWTDPSADEEEEAEEEAEEEEETLQGTRIAPSIAGAAAVASTEPLDERKRSNGAWLGVLTLLSALHASA